MQICKQAPGGYRIAIAIIEHMWLDPDLRYRASSPLESVSTLFRYSFVDDTS